MRTTLDIADDVLHAAKELARRDKKTAGEVISELAKRALLHRCGGRATEKPEGFFGFHPFPSRGGIVTNEIIYRLRDEDAR